MMRTRQHRAAWRTVTALVLVCACSPPVHPSGKEKDAQTHNTLTNDTYRPFLINNIFNYFSNNGDGSYNRYSPNNEGFEFPKGSGKTVVFEDGIVWGCYHKGRAWPKLGGSVYRHGIQAGPLLTNGTPLTNPVPADSGDPTYRIYCVRPDIRPDVPFVTVEERLNADEVPYHARYETVTAFDLYDRYITDWNEWPARDGAPFTDVDRNGVYDPAVDIPGRPGADQTLWYVANDMSAWRVLNLSGSIPIGLEMQRTIWGYRREGALGNTIFLSTVLINKSGAPADSMYLTQWSDPDLGDMRDDLVGCDTTLDLGYVYAGAAPDAMYGDAIPAGGFAFLQGPVVPGAVTDTAFFLSTRRPGFRNIRMNAFVIHLEGFAQYADPASGPMADLQWYRLMRGTTAPAGAPFIDPNTGQATRFCVSGDPVKATDGSAGWVDGQAGLVPGDRRMVMSAGPFTFADGDTQEVVVACLASTGGDRLSSIAALRSDLRAVRAAFARSARGQHAPPVSCMVMADTALAAITCVLDARNSPVTAASIGLATRAEEAVVAIALADDGLHADGTAGDNIWGGIAQIPVRSSGLKADAVVIYPGEETAVWKNVVDQITTTRLRVASYGVVSDNINSDGIANPGENVRYTFALKNDSPLNLRNLVAVTELAAGNGRYHITTLKSHGVYEPAYNPGDPGSYFFFDVPAEYKDPVFRVVIVTTDDSMNIWHDTLSFPVSPMPAKPYATPIEHAAGNATGGFAIQIVDPARVKMHRYVIRGTAGEGGLPGYSLKDSTAGTILLENHPLPDPLGHTSPVVDGFKVLRGTIDATPGMRSWAVPAGTRRFSPSGGYIGLGLEGFSSAAEPPAYDRASGTIGAAMNLQYDGIGTTLTPGDYHTVLLKLAAVNNVTLWDPKAAPADTNISRAYRYLRAASSVAAQPAFAPWIVNPVSGYPYQDYNHGVPFSAWDMDVTPPRRLAVGHMENNVTAGMVDGRYWPAILSADNRIVREIAFIFDAPYTETPDPALAVNMMNSTITPLMWVMTCSRRAEVPWLAGDEFSIESYHIPTAADVWLFDPSVVAGVGDDAKPVSFALLQNYPNPFNPSTTIRYELPAQSEVTITVYDVLGRAVRHLVRSVLPAGSHAVPWHGDTDAGGSVASGVYFYRCSFVRSDRGGQFEQTMKMIVLR